MLETTLAAVFDPGSNPKGDVAGANWLFLLPRLELEHSVCIGAPTRPALRSLAQISSSVTVVDVNSRELRAVTEESRRRGLGNVHTTAAGPAALPLQPGSVDLLLVAGAGGLRRLAHDHSLPAKFQRLLKPEGLLYFEFGGPLGWLLGGKLKKSLVKGLGPSQIFWLTPSRGEMHTAVPLCDHATINYLLRHGLDSPAVDLGTLKAAGELLTRQRQFSGQARAMVDGVGARMTSQPARYLRSIVRGVGVGTLSIVEWAERTLSRHSRLTWRYGALMGNRAADPVDQPPQYLRAIAKEAGISLEKHCWALSVPSDYSSRKVLFYLFDRASGSPEYIAKMTRDPAFNSRLENEYRALTLLREKGIGDREILPRIVFFGHHGSLAIVGETAINGLPFRQRTRATADCPYFRAALGWLLELGAVTADQTGITPAQVAQGLETLFKRFMGIYRLAPAQRDFLASHIADVGQSQTAFPLVFQHGDPGTWNVLVTPGGQAAFLDWEAAEPHGMPLWDLFYFLRSYSVLVARAAGTRDSLSGVTQHFLAESPLSALVIESVERYCTRIGLSGHLVEPLFYTCWMHRALKEAPRLAPARLDNGSYIKLLRLCIEQRNAPTLSRLFSLQTDGYGPSESDARGARGEQLHLNTPLTREAQSIALSADL